jgi:hypothetical protein
MRPPDRVFTEETVPRDGIVRRRTRYFWPEVPRKGSLFGHAHWVNGLVESPNAELATRRAFMITPASGYGSTVFVSAVTTAETAAM